MPAADRALVPDVATLYSDHHGWLLGWLRKRLGNAFDAADLTQDTYVRLLGRSGAEIQAIREPRALLMTIAQGLAANLYRKRCVEQAYLDALALIPEAVAVPRAPRHRAADPGRGGPPAGPAPTARAPGLFAVADRRREAGRHRG